MAEAYLEQAIAAGVEPSLALNGLLLLLNSKYALEHQRLRKPMSIRLMLEDPRLPELSEKFLQKYFIYPSGRLRTSMQFAEPIKGIAATAADRLLINVSPRLFKPSISIAGILLTTGQIEPVRCMSLWSEPLFIPVLRYQRADNTGLIGRKTPYNPAVHCGTYYYLDTGPEVYLLSLRTLIAPYPELAYYHLLGADPAAIDRILEESAAPFPTPYRRKIEDMYSTCLANEAIVSSPSIGKNIEQQLCHLARGQGIDVIIITYPVGPKAGRPEVLDTRSRDTSWSALRRLIP